MEIHKEHEAQTILAYLEYERELWLPAHHVATRDAHMNAAFNAEEAKHMEKIDTLLDELNALGHQAIKGANNGTA
jgi:hypothetical protein